MISRKLIEDALTPRGPQGTQVSLRRGEVVAPGMVSTEPDDLTGSPVDGPAIDGSGAVLSIDGHRIFIPYAPTVPQELAERVEQAVQQATTAQEATNSTHVVAESAGVKAEAAIEGVSAVETAVEAAVQRIDAAQAAADTAATEAGQALHVANLAEAATQGLVKIQESDPGHYPGRIWYQTDATGRGIGIKVSIGGSWVSYMLVADQLLIPSSIGSVLIANGAITAPKLHVDALNFKTATGMELTAGKVIGARVATADTGPRVEMDPQRLARYRDDGEGGLVRTVNIGGTGADELYLADATGGVKAGLSSNGTGFTHGEFSAGSLRVGGDRLDELLDPMPKGIISMIHAYNDSDQAGSSLLGYVRLTGTISTNRMYRLRISGMLAAMQAGDRAYVQLNDVTAGAVLRGGNFVIPTTTAEHVDLEHVFRGTGNGGRNFGVLWRNSTANRGMFWSGRANYPVTAYLEDLGAVGFTPGRFDRFGLTPLSAGSNTDGTGTTTYMKEYAATWTRSWRGSTTVSDFLHHGYYGGLQRYSMAGFGGTLAADMSGATIVKAEVLLDNAHWWGSTGEALIGATTHTSAPASAVTSGTTVASSGWPVGAARWVDITSVWTTAMRAITLGVGAGTGANRYGKFNNTGVQLRVTYRK